MKKFKIKYTDVGFAKMSGSWTQISLGEEIEKGSLIWEWDKELNKYISRFKRLENDHGFITYEIDNLDTWNEKVTPPTDKFIVRLLYTGTEDNFSSIKFTELKKTLNTTLPNEIILQKRFKKKNSSKSLKQKEKEITDFFAEFYKREDCSLEQIDQLKTIDSHYNKIVDNTDYKIGEYYIEELAINNFLCFGEGNIINFSSIPGLVGIFAINRTGKSSILESIMFCLFNKSPKSATSLLKLINDQQPEGTKASVQVKLTINGSHWRIKRTITPTSNGGKVKLEVYEVVDEVEVPRHEESRPQTETKVLRKLLGDEEVFLTTVLCTADNLADFAKNRNADRLDLIIKFLGISVYDQKHKLCDEEYKKTGYLYDQLQEELEKLIPLNELEESMNEKNSELANKIDTSNSLQDQIDVYLGYNKDLEKKIKELNIIGVSKSLIELESELKTITEEQTTKTLQLDTHKKEQKKCLTDWKEKVSIDIWKSTLNQYDDAKTKLTEQKVQIKGLRTQLESELCPTCEQIWHEVDRNQIERSIELLQEEITCAEISIKNHEEKEKKLKGIQETYLSLSNKIELCESKIELSDSKVETISQQIKIVKDNKVKLEKKEQRETKIAANNNSIIKLNKEKQQIDSNILFVKKEIDTLERSIKIYKQKVEDIQEQESVAKGLKLYKKGMHRTGIPSLILETYIPAINSEINSQINDLFELNVKFELIDNSLDISFYYDEFYNQGKGKRDITQASGMEGTVINLAIRAALNKISLLPKPSLWMLDEVFVKLDANNLEQIKPYLERLKEQYYNIALISHQQEIKDIPSHFINLEKIDGITNLI